jgi:ABC-type amino acid transport substrate-binding protein
MFNRILITLIAVGATLTGLASDSEVRLEFSTIEESPDTIASGVVLREAYRRLGIEISIQHFSGAEALRQSNSGQVDGEVCRIDGASKQYTNLVQVSVPINYIQGAVFSKDPDLNLVGWHSLRPYRVGRVKGILFSERGTRGMETVVAEDYDQLIDLLDENEVDVVVAPYLNGRVAILEHPDGEDLKLNGVLESYLLYHYLHQKHRELVPAIERVLKGMVKDGTVTDMRDEVVSQLTLGEDGR